MKTKITIEVESKDYYEIFPEEGQCEEEFETKKEKAELESFRKTFVKDLHKQIIEEIYKHFKDGNFEEQFIDNLEENYIEGWEDFKDYGIKIKLNIKGKC
jgi:hypothetical protein